MGGGAGLCVHLTRPGRKLQPMLRGSTIGKLELVDTVTERRSARRDGRGRFTDSDDVRRSPRVNRPQTAKAPGIYGLQPPADPPAALPEGIPELVVATREQTAAIERQTAVMERFLTFLSPAAAAHDRQKAADNAGPDAFSKG